MARLNIGLKGFGVAFVAVLLTACAQVAPISLPLPGRASDQEASTQVTQVPAVVQQPTAAKVAGVATPTAVAISAPPLIQTVRAQRGSISESVQLDGRVTTGDEVPLAFPQKSVASKVSAKTGDTVSAGQILVEADPTVAQKEVKDAQEQVDAATGQLNQARQQAADHRQATATSQQDAIATATEALRKAQADYAAVQAGASAIDKQSADAAVATAQAALQKAQSDLANLKKGTAQADLLTAQQQVASAQLGVRQAQADLARVTGGPDPADVRAAQRQVADAQSAQETAQAELDRLTQGPDPYDLRAAQRAVDAAQAALDAANAAPSGASAGQSNRQAAITSAKLQVQDAQDRLAKLKQPPTADVLVAARTKVDDAKAAVAAGQDKLDALKRPPDQLAIDKANAAVQAAQLTLDQATAKVDQLKAGPSADDVQTASAAVDAAQMNLNIAQAKRDDVYGRPSAAELQDAQARVAAAQKTLERAQQAAPSPEDGVDTAQRGLQKAQDQLAQAQADLEATRLRAPFDGRVVAVMASQGAALDGDTPAVVIAKSNGDPYIAVTLPAAQRASDSTAGGSASSSSRASTSLVSNGLQATVQIDGTDGKEFSGVVGAITDGATPSSRAGVVDGPATGARTALIQVDWGSATPKFGATALVRIKVRQKANALVVPSSAVQTAGAQKYVEVVQDNTRTLQPITTGIVGDTDTEVLTGLTEGQVVSLPAGAAAPLSSDSIAHASGTPTTLPSAAAPRTSASLTISSDAAGSPAIAPGAADNKPLFEDTFVSNDAGWVSDPRSTAWVDINGGYHLLARQASQFVAIGAPLAVASIPQNVVVTAHFQKIGGPAGGGYGIMIHDQDPASHTGTNQSGGFYVLEVGDKGEVGVWRRDASRWIDIVPWTHSDVVHTGQTDNELAVTSVGDQLTFVVNGVQVATPSDSTLKAGGVGVFVGGDMNEVLLSHFTVQGQ